MNTQLTLSTIQEQTPTATSKNIVMDVRDITKTLPLGKERISILKGISFQILSGEFVSIVGPSGSGKSTLLGIIAGLDNPTTGQVLIDGVDITRMTEGKLAAVRNSKIGMVFQAFNLIPTLTAQENVEVPLYVGKHKGSPSARAQELLALVGLSHRLDHRPNQLSGGEQLPVRWQQTPPLLSPTSQQATSTQKMVKMFSSLLPNCESRLGKPLLSQRMTLLSHHTQITRSAS